MLVSTAGAAFDGVRRHTGGSSPRTHVTSRTTRTTPVALRTSTAYWTDPAPDCVTAHVADPGAQTGSGWHVPPPAVHASHVTDAEASAHARLSASVAPVAGVAVSASNVQRGSALPPVAVPAAIHVTSTLADAPGPCALLATTV